MNQFWVTTKLGLAFAISSLICADAIAQSQLSDGKRATVAFDIHMSKLMNTDLAKDLNAEDQAKMASGGTPVKVEQVDRIYGAMTLPKSLEEAQSMGMGGDLPIELFVRLIYKNAEEATAAFEEFASKGTKTERGGKQFIAPPEDEEGPTNLLLHQVNETTLEFATETYALHRNRAVFSKKLMANWKKMEVTPVRIAADLDSSSAMIGEAVKMMNADLPPVFQGFTKLLNELSGVQISTNPQKKVLLSITTEGKSDAGAEKIEQGLAALLGMAQLGLKPMLADAPPELAKMAEGAMGALKPVKSGKMVTLTLNEPEGFGDAVKAMSGAVGGARKAAGNVQKKNRFRQAALAFHNYHDVFRKSPMIVPDGTSDKLSWRVRVLPFLEENALYEEINKKEGPDSQTNKKFAKTISRIYDNGAGMADIAFIKPEKVPTKIADVIDGTSNTIMMIENPKGSAWMEANDPTIDEAIGWIKALGPDESLIIAYYDGSIGEVTAKDADTIKSKLTPNGLD